MNQDLQKELYDLAEKYCPEKDGEHGEDCLYHELVPLMEKVRKEALEECVEVVKESYWQCPMHGLELTPEDCDECGQCAEVNVVLVPIFQALKTKTEK